MDLGPLAVALLAYTLATGLFLGHLFTNRPRLADAARLAMMLGAVSHGVWAYLRYRHLGLTPLTDVHEALSAFAWLLVAGYLVLRLLQPRIDVVGLFLAPIAEVLLAVGVITAPTEAVGAKVGSTLLPVHVAAAILGTAALALASTGALMYLLLERHLKQKRFGAVYQRFPSLNLLDSISYRCAAVGFPLLTIGIITGVFTAREALVALLLTGSRALQYTIGIAGWVLFGAMLQARLLAGWRGRRAAVLTIAGFVCALTVLLIYLAR